MVEEGGVLPGYLFVCNGDDLPGGFAPEVFGRLFDEVELFRGERGEVRWEVGAGFKLLEVSDDVVFDPDVGAAGVFEGLDTVLHVVGGRAFAVLAVASAGDGCAVLPVAGEVGVEKHLVDADDGGGAVVGHKGGCVDRQFLELGFVQVEVSDFRHGVAPCVLWQVSPGWWLRGKLGLPGLFGSGRVGVWDGGALSFGMG